MRLLVKYRTFIRVTVRNAENRLVFQQILPPLHMQVDLGGYMVRKKLHRLRKILVIETIFAPFMVAQFQSH